MILTQYSVIEYVLQRVLSSYLEETRKHKLKLMETLFFLDLFLRDLTSVNQIHFDWNNKFDSILKFNFNNVRGKFMRSLKVNDKIGLWICQKHINTM